MTSPPVPLVALLRAAGSPAIGYIWLERRRARRPRLVDARSAAEHGPALAGRLPLHPVALFLVALRAARRLRAAGGELLGAKTGGAVVR